MTLGAVPACTVATVSTAGVAGFTAPRDHRLQRADERARTHHRIGRLVRTRAVRAAPHELDLERVRRRRPAGRLRHHLAHHEARSTWPPKMADTPSSAPLASIAAAPAPVSSAGCSTTSTSPSAGRSASRCAAPTAHDACTSCPQACITPGVVDAYGSPVASWMGRASMSPRTATSGARGSRPRMRATSPVPATRSSDAGRSTASARSSASAVRDSANASSGCRCRSRRSATSASRRSGGKSAASASGTPPTSPRTPTATQRPPWSVDGTAVSVK
jgi:hypothetical protein